MGNDTEDKVVVLDIPSPPYGPPMEFWKPKIYVCPSHGEIDATINSSHKGREGDWCQLCFIDSLERIGVHRVTEKKETA